MTEVYLLFWQSVALLFTNFNRFFQKEEPLVYLLHEEMQKIMNKLASQFVKPEVIQQINEEKKSFLALNVSRENQREGQNIHIQLLQKDIDNKKAVSFDIAHKFYEIACKYFHSTTFFIKTVLLLILQSLNPLTLCK